MLLSFEGDHLNKSVRNERRKLTANFTNGVALAGIAVGVFTQVSGMLGTGNVTGSATIFLTSCLVLAGALHLVARASLAGLEE